MTALNLQEVARRLGVSDQVVRKLIHDGKLAAFKPAARRYRVLETELDRYVESTRVKPTTAPGEVAK